ncbi:MAG: SpoVR family protein, partial [Heliobacteriaceae bacterium]|nr:SpoVR family protein [Heliobacteriaceae bacterium]
MFKRHSQRDRDMDRLSRSIPKLIEIAKGFGLDFYDMRFEVVPAEVIYTVGAYGMPTRFTHWSFGKAFHRMKLAYDYNLSRIYELVINSDPCYAFLLEGNIPVQNELVVAHVLAHADFFKNNAAFAGTSRFMVESMASSAERIRGYELEYGREKVERFLDAALAIQEHVDYHANTVKDAMPAEPKVQPDSPYEDLFALDQWAAMPVERGKGDLAGDDAKEQGEERPKTPLRPEKDILLFIMKHSPYLADWQRDILSVIRDEMLYFWPQIRTKIMNEGWATFFHLRIMREMPLSEADAWEFAKMHAGVIQPSKVSLNPYYVGLKIFEAIEKRWGEDGRRKIFEIRELETDQSFLRNYLTKELVEALDLYLYKKVGNQWQVVEKQWEAVRDGLVAQLTNGGFPTVYVADADYKRAGELLLHHAHEGVDLDIPYLEKTLPHIYLLWGKTVHLGTVTEGRKIVFSYDGEKTSR